MKTLARLLPALPLLWAGIALAQTPDNAPDSIVEMYGMGMPVFDNAKTQNATVTPPADRPNQVPASAYTGFNDVARNRITVGTSHWGFRGYERLGPRELRLVWQMESAFQLDQNNGPGIAARDNKVGLRHERLGEIFMGQWDTPYKYISLPINPIRAGYVFNHTAILGNPGFGVPFTTTIFTRTGGKADAAFDRRQGNSVQYWSPNWGGFTFRLMHSVNEGKGAVAGGPVISPIVNSAMVQYDVGTLSLRYGYEENKDYFGMAQLGGSAGATATNQHSKDKAHKFVVLWLIGNTRITGAVERLDYSTDDTGFATNVNRYKRTAWYAVVEQRFGKNGIWVSYGRAEDGSCGLVSGFACSTHGLGADYLTLGYIYRFSRRTEVFAMYYRVNNKDSAQYSPGPTVSGAIVAPGADTVAYGVGIIHFF